MYADEAEKAIFNHLVGAQHTNGIDWCYMTPPNERTRAFEPRISCCASSGPRALEMFSAHLAGEIDSHLSINSLSPSTVQLPDKFGGGKLTINGDFPVNSESEIYLKTERTRKFTVEIRIPNGTVLTSVKINGNKKPADRNERNFYQITSRWNPGMCFLLNLIIS